jgi:DNA mismatch endonuclease, patch repair protein
MADVHDKKTRSYNMSRIKSKNTGPEMAVRRFLHSKGFRFRLYVKSLPGKPDIVLRKYKTIIDVRGCFWHGHKGCKWGDKVKTKSEIMHRVKSAIKRDKINQKKWQKEGWNIIIVWDSCELEIKKTTSLKRTKVLRDIVKQLNRTLKQKNKTRKSETKILPTNR